MSPEPIDRATPDDLVSLATDVGPTPMQVGAVLVLDTESGFDPEGAVTALATRIRSVPRLRQRLVSTPFGCGRPMWVDDDAFDLHAHVQVVHRDGGGDEAAMLEFAADLIGTRLPADRPLWRISIVTGLDGDRAALVIVFHHVLADGIGGLAVLADLVDGLNPGPIIGFPRPAPRVGALARDAARARVDAIRMVPAWMGRFGDALRGLRTARPHRLAASSLNRPTGRRRRVTVVRVDLDDVHRVASRHRATINDVILTAVAGALASLLDSRGEAADRFVVSIPVSTRQQTTATDLGNHVGVAPVELPATGGVFARLETIAARTRAAKQATDTGATALLGPVFRLLARLGIFGWFINRQRLVHTFVTNLRGPDSRLQFVGRPIVDIVPVAMVTGNVTVSFAVLSYAGTLEITIVFDPDACPDLPVLRDALADELRSLTDEADE